MEASSKSFQANSHRFQNQVISIKYNSNQINQMACQSGKHRKRKLDEPLWKGNGI
jgi:hypothetical protein